MGANRKKLYKYLVVIAAAVFFGSAFWSCANVTSGPQGGPKDTLPPVVVGTNPKMNSTNIYPKKLTITFDEYIQLKDLQKEFFTSPFMDVRPTTLVKGRGIETEIKATLDSATTYVLNYGSSVSDNNEGNVFVGLKYAFSTGDHIDSMYMTGFVQDSRTADTVRNAYLMFFDALKDSIPGYDSLMFDLSAAKAVGRTTPNGIFIHENLKALDYRVYAMVDNNSNQIYDPGVDDVAFMDTVYNPATMPAFYMWYDTIRLYNVAEPQMFMRTFREDADGRQLMTGQERPERQKIMLKFSARNPRIDTLVFRDIDPGLIITEQLRETHDSTFYWLNIPYDEIADTIYADITYMRHDTAGVLVPFSQELRFTHKRPYSEVQEEERQEKELVISEKRAARLEKRRLKRLERQERKRVKRLLKAGITREQMNMSLDSLALIDSVAAQILAAERKITEHRELEQSKEEAVDSTGPVSNMKYKLSGGNSYIPVDDMILSFDYPVIEFDTTGITLTRIHKVRNEDVESAVPVSITQDSVKIREYKVKTDEWVRGDKYRFVIPQGRIKTLDGEINDTISREFAVAEPQKYSMLVLTFANTDPRYEYIVNIYDGSGKNLQREVAHLTEGEYTIEYISPGKISLLVIEDRNRNGKWDTGDLVKREQPEKVEAFIDPETGSREINMKANWDVKYTIEVPEIFKPRVHASSIDLDKGEGFEGEGLQKVSGGDKTDVIIDAVSDDNAKNINEDAQGRPEAHSHDHEGKAEDNEQALGHENIPIMENKGLVLPDGRSEGAAFIMQQEDTDEESR